MKTLPLPKTGVLLVHKESGVSSFHLVSLLRKKTGIAKIGHAGTLDPFATGVMVMLVGREYTKQSDSFLCSDKQYRAHLHLGVTTDTHDPEGKETSRSTLIPTKSDIEEVVASFQGELLQIPPMFSAKKIDGQKLYHLARQGVTIERKPSSIQLQTQLLSYNYPHLELLIDCSKGTYIRVVAHDIGEKLSCGAYLTALERTRSGSFSIEQCIPQQALRDPLFDLEPHFRRL